MRIVLWLLLVSLADASSLVGRSAETLVRVPVTNSPWNRIVMVGASATAGFTASEMLGGTNTPMFRLSRYVDAAVLAPHEPVQNLAHALFFMQWEAAGRQQIDEALKAGPTLLIGIDFLFWFCYGGGLSEEERLQRFEKGLTFLEAVQCPLIVGDIPDASAAIGSVLRADEVPRVETLAAANRRLQQWAASRAHVVVVSLSGFMRTVSADRALTIHGETIPEGETRILLQPDKLHPSPPGAAVLALAILDAFQSTRRSPATNEVCWNAREVFRLGFKPATTRSGALPK